MGPPASLVRAKHGANKVTPGCPDACSGKHHSRRGAGRRLDPNQRRSRLGLAPTRCPGV